MLCMMHKNKITAPIYALYNIKNLTLIFGKTVKLTLRSMAAFMPALCFPNAFIFRPNLGLKRAQSGHKRMKRHLFDLF